MNSDIPLLMVLNPYAAMNPFSFQLVQDFSFIIELTSIGGSQFTRVFSSSSFHNYYIIMEIASIQIEKILSEENVEAMSVRWNLDDTLLAIGCSDGSVKIYSDEGFIRSMQCHIAAELMPITSIRWKPATGKTKNVLIANTCDGGIYQFHASSGRLMHCELLENNPIFSCDYNSDGSAFAIGCNDASIKIYDESTKEILIQLGPSKGYDYGHNSRVCSIKWINENSLISGGWDNKVIIWDIRQKTIIQEIFGPHICGDSLDIKNGILLTGSYDRNNQLQLWDIGSGRNIFSTKLLSGNKECLAYTAQFSKVDEILACGGSGSDESYFFNSNPVIQIGVVANLTKPVYSVDFCNTSNKVAIGCGDGSIVVCKVKKNNN